MAPVSDDAPCDHTDAYGSTVMDGGPRSAYPGRRMCIVCDELVPPLSVAPAADDAAEAFRRFGAAVRWRVAE